METLYAISDLHVDHKMNFDAITKLRYFPDSGLLIAGDISHDLTKFRHCLDILSKKFSHLFWVPGNHDLWSIESQSSKGLNKYRDCLDICNDLNIYTPEDEFFEWRSSKGIFTIVLCFIGYDYSFRPLSVSLDNAIAWAKEDNTFCTDEKYLFSTPFPTKQVWCDDRIQYTENRLNDLNQKNLILVNHYPLTRHMVYLPRVPRFSIWSGTTKTEHWLSSYNIHTFIYGHCHVRQDQVYNNTRCCEVSFGYPNQQYWGNDLADYLRIVI